MTRIRLTNGEWTYDEGRPLGRPGGFGAVFLGSGDAGPVAVKRLSVGAADAHREIDMARELSSRDLVHVVPMLDWGRDEAEDAFFVVMPVCDGSLADQLARETPLDMEEARDVASQIVDGLLEVSDIVHRDLKPGNVLKKGGHWCVSDFGIAKLVADSTSADTLRDVLSAPYAAPEQWRGERPVAATDVYALGCIIHEMVNGQPPFVADDRWSLMDMHLHAEVPALSGGDTRLATFVRRMLSKEPDSRPTLARCREVLRTTGKAQQPHTGIAAAAAEIAQERARIEAEAARVRTREQRRAAIVRDGAAELIGAFDRLGGALRQATEDAGVSEDVLSLGRARLRRQRVEPVDVELQAVEVVAWSSLELRQMGATGGNNLLGSLSASLLLARFGRDDPFRWFEAGYWSLTDKQDAPFSISPDSQSFNYVFSNVMSSVSLAYGPLPIDGEDEQEFQRRWLGLIGRAAVGKLHRPGSLPLPAGWFD